MMQDDRTTLVATAIVFVTGAFWGLYWLPVRSLDAAGLGGAWGTVAISAAAALLLLPVVAARGRIAGDASAAGLAALATGGAAFAFYSVGFVHGRVAIIVLLYFLTPVWSALIGRYVMGWPSTGRRMVAIALGLAGLAVMLGANGTVPIPRGAGEWMALIAGILWSVGTTGMRAKSRLAPPEAALVFSTGACVTAVALALALDPLPDPAAIDRPLRAGLTALTTGALWWALSVGGLMWATVRLEPVRVGLLLMAEVLVGAVSAALIAGEAMTVPEIAGGALVLVAGIVDVWPGRRRRQTPT